MPLRRHTRALALIAPLVAGCRERKTVAIGDAYALSTETGTLSEVIRGGIDALPMGRRIQIIPWSVGEGEELRRATEQAERFAATRSVVGVVGHAGSRDALLGARVYNAMHLPQVVPNATSTQLASVGPWTFTLVGDDAYEGEFLATYALDSLHAKRVAVMHVGDEYGNGLRDGVARALRARQRSLVDDMVLPNASCDGAQAPDEQRLPVLASLRRGDPDAVILALGVANGPCVTALLLRERPTLHVLGADGVAMTDSAMGTLPPEVRDRYRGVEFAFPTDRAGWNAFRARVRDLLHRDPTPTEALRYDAYLLLATAITDGGSDRAAVRAWLESLGRSRPAWPGVTGPIAFTAGRRRVPLRMIPAARRAE